MHDASSINPEGEMFKLFCRPGIRDSQPNEQVNLKEKFASFPE
jgi:hypothetical protein